MEFSNADSSSSRLYNEISEVESSSSDDDEEEVDYKGLNKIDETDEDSNGEDDDDESREETVSAEEEDENWQEAEVVENRSKKKAAAVIQDIKQKTVAKSRKKPMVQADTTKNITIKRGSVAANPDVVPSTSRTANKRSKTNTIAGAADPKLVTASTSGIAKKTKASVAKANKTTNMISPKSLTTKDMIIQAVAECKNKRKGASVQYIKKHITEKYEVNNYRINQVTKLLKVAGNEGWLLQMTGTGAASGSYFKLADDVKKALKKQREKDEKMEEKAKEKKPASKAKEATKRKAEKKSVDKEKDVPAKKRKVAEGKAPKKKAAAKTSKKASA